LSGLAKARSGYGKTFCLRGRERGGPVATVRKEALKEKPALTSGGQFIVRSIQCLTVDQQISEP